MFLLPSQPIPLVIWVSASLALSYLTAIANIKDGRRLPTSRYLNLGNESMGRQLSRYRGLHIYFGYARCRHVSASQSIPRFVQVY